MADATFHDGQEQPLRLLARDADDLRVISACAQDAIFSADKIRWDRKKRTLVVLLNRFRWEDAARRNERVQTILQVSDVIRVQSTGISRDENVVLSMLSAGWAPGPEGTGRLEFVLAGDGAIGIDVECLEVSLADVTRPYAAPSGKRPSHQD